MPSKSNAEQAQAPSPLPEVTVPVMANSKMISSEFFDRSIRAEIIIHIGSQLHDDSAWPENIQETFDYCWDDIWESAGLEPPESEDKVDVFQRFYHAGKLGFLIQFATPIPKNITETGHSFSWGCFTQKWIYADTYEEACQQATQWQEEFIETARFKAIHKNDG